MTIILVAYGVSREEVGGNNLVIAPVWEVFHSVFDFGIELERSIALSSASAFISEKISFCD
jgi:hypothetical protein